MKINFSKLKFLPVMTESGVALGRVKDLEIDIENYDILKFIVSQGWLKNEILIAPNQVLKITSKQITVSDNTQKEIEPAAVETEISQNAISPVIESKIQE
jgi:sporulation protein YlmC with PRC-barrel domain